MSMPKGKHSSQQSGFRISHVPTYRVPPNQPGPTDGGSTYSMNVNHYQQPPPQPGAASQPPQSAGGPPPQQQPPPSAQMRVAMQHAVMQQQQPPQQQQQQPPPSQQQQQPPPGPPPHQQQQQQHPTPTSTPPSADMGKTPLVSQHPQMQQQTMSQLGYNPRAPTNGGVFRMANPSQSRIQPNRNLVQVLQPSMQVGFPPISNLQHLQNPHQHFSMPQFQPSGRQHTQGSSHLYYQTIPVNFATPQIGSYPNYFILPNSVGSSGQYISAPAPIRQYATPGNAAAAAAAAAAGQMPPGLGGGGHSAAANHAVAAAAAMGVTALGPGATQSMLQQQQPPPQMASQHPQQQPTQNYQKAKRKHAIPIINPDTMKEIDDIITPTPSGNSITPPISTDSSARQTPQPGSAVSQDTSDVTADQQQTPSFHPHSHPTPHLTDIKPPAANGGAGAGADDTRAGPATAETVTTVTVTANGPTSLDISETQVPISEVKTASKPPPQPYSTAAAADKTTKVASSVQEKQRDSAATPIVSASDEIMTPRTISNKETTPSSKDSAAKGAANVAQSQSQSQSPAKSLNRKQSGRGGAPSESASASEKSQTQSPVVVATPVATALAAATESQAKPQPAAAADAQPVVAASAQPAAQSPAAVEATTAVKKETPAAVEAAPKEETPKEKTKPLASAKESAAAATPAQQAPPPAAAAVEPIVVPVEQKQPAFSTTPSFAQLINFSPLQKPTMPPPQVIVPPPPAAAVAADNETTTTTTKTHTNGEIPADSPEGKACQRQATKKNKKLKEFNQKGAKKEGSEMDAFTENNVEEKEKSVTPQPTTTPLTVNNKLPPSDVTSKDDLQEKLVAAKNEENIKVSALSKQQTAGEQGDNNNTTTALPIIDKTQSTPAQPQQPVLKHKYKEDQWSPLNPEGKKKYDREFLMGLQNDPQATKKPDNLPNIDIVQLEPPNRNKFSNQISYSQPSRGGTHDFAPNFFKSSSMRGSLPKRNSQQGNKGAKPTKAVHLSTSLREDKRLKDSENAWKPTRLKEAKDVTEEDKKTQELYKKVRSILNKLTPQKFDTLVSQVRKLPIDTPERMNGVINLVFDKAIAEPGYSKAYAGMCKLVSNMEVKDSTSEKNDKNGENEKKVVFRKSLIMRCQFEFESNKNAELCSAKRLKEIDECTDHEKKRELQLSYEEEERRIRKKSVGNVRFIGELYILDMLTAPIMHRCINELLQKHEEEPLECLCKLLTTIGKKLENATIKINEAARLEKQKELTSLDTYFAAMKDLSQKRDNSKLSSRVRFMLQDVIDLKQNNWVPRRDENNPKTMDQIQREANRESMEMSISLQSHRKQDMRSGGGGGGGGFGGDDRRGGGGGRNRSMNQNDDKDGGWQSVGSGKNMRQPQYLMESYRLTMLKQQAEEPRQLTLGSSNAFGQWRLGASAAKSSSMGGEQKSIVTSSNKYEALTRERGSDERKGPSMTFKSGGGGRISHSPSMEKERPTLDNKEDTERRSSSQRRPQLSQPSSRDHTPTPSAAPAPPPASSAPTPSTNNPPPTPDKEIRRTAIATLEEFILNKNVEEALQCVGIFTNPVDKMNLVKQMLEYSLESKSKAFQGLGKLLVELIKGEILTADPLVLTVFNEYLDFAVESEAWIDSPKVFQYFSEVIVPLVQSSMLSFRHLADMCKRLKETAADIYMKAMMANIITSLIKEFSNEWVKNKWISSNVEPSDFGFDANDANDQKILQFLSSTRSEAPTSSRMSMNEVQTKLVGFLKSDNMKYEEICDWIESNVGEDIQKPAFISALITAICEVSVDITKKPFTDNLLKNHSNLIRKYVSSYDVQDLEVQCLRSVAAFVNKLQHPPGLLLTIFSHLWDASLISSESFISWKEVDAVEEGMGVALMSLVSFFTSLNEGDSDGNS